MIGFRWIVKEKLAGSAQPGLYADWEEDLDFLQRRDIGFIMSLTESPDIEENAKAAGLGFYHLPIRDMDVPPKPKYFAADLFFKARDKGRRQNHYGYT